MINELKNEIRELRLQVSKLSVIQRPSFAQVIRQRNVPILPKHNTSFPAKFNNNHRVFNPPAIHNSTHVAPINPIICYNCGGPNHLAKECNLPIMCRFCKRTGVNSIQCSCKPNKFNATKRIRQFDDRDQISEPDTMDLLNEEHCNVEQDSPDRLQTLENNIENCYAIKKYPSRNVKFTYPKDVEKWGNYVIGHCDKPKLPIYKAKTMISSSHSEYAANKPIVACKIHNDMKNVLFDSGSESNVIDAAYAKKINAKVWRKPGVLRCANGSPLRIIGFTVVNMAVSGIEMQCKFTVVDSIFPNVIVGIKTMKKENILINPGKDCCERHKI